MYKLVYTTVKSGYFIPKSGLFSTELSTMYRIIYTKICFELFKSGGFVVINFFYGMFFVVQIWHLSPFWSSFPQVYPHLY